MVNTSARIEKIEKELEGLQKYKKRIDEAIECSTNNSFFKRLACENPSSIIQEGMPYNKSINGLIQLKGHLNKTINPLRERRNSLISIRNSKRPALFPVKHGYQQNNHTQNKSINSTIRNNSSNVSVSATGGKRRRTRRSRRAHRTRRALRNHWEYV